MQKPIGRIETLAASGRLQLPGQIPLVRARTVSITVNMTFGSSIDADPTIEVYYSPDGRNFDTYVLTSWGMTYDASATEQITKIIDVPEHGMLIVKVLNGSSADTITNVVWWYSIQSWPEWPAQSRGLIETADVYD